MIHEHLGDNRSGKSYLEALGAWEAYNQGKDVYVNCPEDPHDPTGYNCILNFPHYHIDLDKMRDQNLFNCYLMTDESVEFMDARRAASNSVREIGLFGYQATKRGVDWHYDAVRHKNIDPRIRLNPHYIHESFRIPKDPRQPLVSIRVQSTYRYGGRRTWYVLKPWLFYPIYNHIVLVRNEAD